MLTEAWPFLYGEGIEGTAIARTRLLFLHQWPGSFVISMPGVSLSASITSPYLARMSIVTVVHSYHNSALISLSRSFSRIIKHCSARRRSSSWSEQIQVHPHIGHSFCEGPEPPYSYPNVAARSPNDVDDLSYARLPAVMCILVSKGVCSIRSFFSSQKVSFSKGRVNTNGNGPGTDFLASTCLANTQTQGTAVDVLTVAYYG